MAFEERPVREFLLSLPRLAGESYNEAVSYLVWQTVEQCVIDGIHSIDWSSKHAVFKSRNWQTGAFMSLQLPPNWRAAFFKNVEILSGAGSNGHRGSSCSRICRPPETVYYCFDCTRNPLYEICSECFDPQRHEGHRYTSRLVTRPEGRVCHCGDTSVLSAANEDHEGPLRCRNAANNDPISLDYESDSDPNLISVLEQMIDYIIDTIVYFKELSEDPERTILAHDNGVSEFVGMEYALQLNGHDCNWHIKDLATKISLLLNKPLEYGLMITEILQRGDPSVVLVKSKNLAKLEEVHDAFAAESIHLKIITTSDVFKEKLVDELTNLLYTLCVRSPSLKLKISLRVALCGTWRSGLRSTKHTPDVFSPFTPTISLLGGFVVPFEQRLTFPWFKAWEFPHSGDKKHDPSILRIMRHYDERLRKTSSHGLTTRCGLLEGSRFQNLLVQGSGLFPNLWKCRLLNIVSCVFTIIDDSRNCIAAQYIDIYSNLLYNTVESDSAGHKLSIMSSLSQLVFQVPRVANMIIPSGFIERVLQVAFTLMSFPPHDLVECPPVPLYRDFKLPKDSIKNKRSIICFKDIYLVFSTNTSAKLLLTSESILQCMIKCFAAFSNVLPLTRETSEHVEFENFEFSSYYFYFSSVLVMVDGFARNICLLEDRDTRINIVKHFLSISMEKEFELLRTSGHVTRGVSLLQKAPEQVSGLRVCHERVGDTTADIIDFEVGTAPQTFFSPMSYFFKFVTLWSQCGRYTPLTYPFHQYMKMEEIFADKRQIIWMCESALSTLVLLAQITSGYWVRNGSPIQHQARMYTKYSMREFTYFSDIYMLQLAMSIGEPIEFFITYISRWGLKQWAQGMPSGDYPDIEITTSMVDQCFLLLIHLFSEIRNPAMKSSIEGFEMTMHAELAHALCFKNSTHSELLNIIPEHVTKHPAFDLYLHDMALYTPPTEMMDAGIYSLKEDYYSIVDPYFLGYSSSKRYEAEKLIRSRAAARLKCDYSQTFIPAKECCSKLRSSVFCKLYQISGTDVFWQFIKRTLDHIVNLNHDVLLGKVTHLIHLCVVNYISGFSSLFWKEFDCLGSQDPYYNSIGSILFSFLSNDDFINEHGKIREIYRCFTEKAPHVDITAFLSEQTPSLNFDLLRGSMENNEKKDEGVESRKQLAKAKRLKFMRRIAKQQQKFLANNQVSLDYKTALPCHQHALEDEWIPPELMCVFCKMGKEDDPFVYFSFVERNICELLFCADGQDAEGFDREINVDGAVKKSMETGPVIRTCGHGSHESCLVNHMKSVRTVHNHITKNVPNELGFSLFFCPLCSSLSNSFLPYIPPHYKSGNAENNLEEKLSKSCYKSAMILDRLFQDKESRPMVHTDVISSIKANTIKNAEMASRLNRKTKEDGNAHGIFLTNQHMVSLKLLSDLKQFLGKPLNSHQQESIDSRVTLELLNPLDGRIQFGVIALEAKPQALRDLTSSESGATMQIPDHVKHCLLQDVLFLTTYATRLGELSCNKAVQDRSCLNPSPGELEELQIFSALVKRIPKLQAIEKRGQAKPELAHVFRMLRDSMTVRMRRVGALMYLQGLSKKPKNSFGIDFNNLDYLLEFCGMSSFSVLLKTLMESTLERTFSRNEVDGDSFGLKLCCYDRNPMIELPDSYTQLMDTNCNGYLLKTKREETAICLLCGVHVRVQNPVALQSYSIGECTDHCLNDCPSVSGFGCFLLTLSNTVYLAYGHRGTFYQAPFLNQHGETDEDYRNGAPVFLSRERYLHLSQDVVLGNMIPHLVYRLTDNSSDLGGWESM
ncbi:LAFA_0B03004g1_1 [Lachancea sp. 'fantastica']|nr:LAFA_0B03004g1_1 [Lachancea sp. 'fantastica']